MEHTSLLSQDSCIFQVYNHLSPGSNRDEYHDLDMNRERERK